MKAFTIKTKMAATMVASLAALSGAALAHSATAREVTPTDPNLEVRVVQLGEVPEFWAANCPLALRSAAAWADGDTVEATALHNEGFTVGVRELLRSNSGELGASVGLRFRSAAGARADLDRRVQLAGSEGYATSVAVAESPSVRTYSVRGDGLTTVHAAFTRGLDEYAIVVQAGNGTDIGALERTLAMAATRVAGRG